MKNILTKSVSSCENECGAYPLENIGMDSSFDLPSETDDEAFESLLDGICNSCETASVNVDAPIDTNSSTSRKDQNMTAPTIPEQQTSMLADKADDEEADAVDMTEFEKRQLTYLKVQNMIAVDFLQKVADNLLWAEDQVHSLRSCFDNTELDEVRDECLKKDLGYLADDLFEVAEQIGEIIELLRSGPVEQ